MEKMNDLKALLQHEVEDLVSAEEQIIAAMPAMIERAQNAELKKTLQEHLAITEKQRERLTRVQEMLGGNGDGGENKGIFTGILNVFGGTHSCKGMEGIISEGQRIMKADMTPEVMDAAIIACAQKIEHYEICGYGTARAYAMQIDADDVAKLLEETLGEEYHADHLLTQIALDDVNEKAEHSGEDEPGKTPPKKAVSKKAAAKKVTPKKTPPKKAPKKSPTKKVQTKQAAGPKKAAPKKALKK